MCLEKKLLASGVRREDWWRPGDGEHEVTFALQLMTLELKLHHDRVTSDAWKKAFPLDEWLTGTIDWLHWGDAETLAWVDDLKTGHWPVDPKTSKQLRSYLLVPWVHAGRPRDWEGCGSITQWEKYPLDGQPRRKPPVRLTTLGMTEHLDDLRWAAQHPTEVNATEDGCRFCDSKSVCPAWVDEPN